VSGGGRLGHAPAAPGRAGTGYRGSPMAPITLQRLVKQLDKLKPEADAARLKTHDYGRWLARMIRRLRERGLDADRAAATAASSGPAPSASAASLAIRLWGPGVPTHPSRSSLNASCWTSSTKRSPRGRRPRADTGVR